jgi:hypothetical protein
VTCLRLHIKRIEVRDYLSLSGLASQELLRHVHQLVFQPGRLALVERSLARESPKEF